MQEKDHNNNINSSEPQSSQFSHIENKGSSKTIKSINNEIKYEHAPPKNLQCNPNVPTLFAPSAHIKNGKSINNKIKHKHAVLGNLQSNPTASTPLAPPAHQEMTDTAVNGFSGEQSNFSIGEDDSSSTCCC